MSTPPRETPPLSGREPQGPRLLSAVMTVLALAPVCAVGGAVIAYKLGADMAPWALGGALVGILVALFSQSR
jgi:energy-converting hydrogenase Eha subunit A